MRAIHSKSALFLFAAVLLLMSMPRHIMEKSRDVTISFLAPGWNILTYYKNSAASLMETVFTSKIFLENSMHLTLREQIEQLQLQNELLRLELRRVRGFQHQEAAFNQLSTMESIPARVIFRSPQSWHSSLWINVGSSSNEGNDKPIVAKNSPVLIGDCVVGVLDYVGKNQSRVRLITDSSLVLSVRVLREEGNGKWFLAKGELHGGSAPLWRGYKEKLKGIGFNYDFSDEKGPARDLRTGAPLKKDSRFPPMLLISVKDLLVTTGMDGVFPEGLKVAEVTRINSLKEGDYYYELEAKSLAGNLEDISLVFIISPLGYDAEDQP